MNASVPVRTGILIVAGDASIDEHVVQTVMVKLRHSLPALFLTHQQRISSQRYWVEEILRRWCDEEEVDLLLTLGGTFPAPGPSSDEIVPEATAAILERQLPALPETMRAYALDETPMAILDRGVAGIRGRTVILNLPGETDLAPLFLEGIADLLPLILNRVRQLSTGEILPAEDDSVEPAPSASTPPSGGGLNAEEFAEFLRKRRESGGDSP